MAGKWAQLCVTDADSHAKNLVVTSGQSPTLATPYSYRSVRAAYWVATGAAAI